MKPFSFFLLLVVLYSCGKNKSVLLPEVQNAPITEIRDVSHAYLFYDESKNDKVDLNRKNLISTTNWLINIDKRLTLEQAIPQVMFLQNKKRDAKMHKNENAKNYFTCNDTSIQNLGFLEFTDVVYQTTSIRDYFKFKLRKETLGIILNTQAPDSYILEFKTFKNTSTVHCNDLDSVIIALQKAIAKQNDHKLYLLLFSELTFQDYIDVKSMIAQQQSSGLEVDNNEFIY